jgi:PAS domain S-box-containing protein
MSGNCWYIGAGVYIDEIDTLIAKNQQAFQDKVLEHVKIMALVLFCLLFIHFFTAAFFSRSIWKQIELFSQFFRRASTESISMDSEHLIYSEFREISNLANAMLEQKNGFLREISLSRDEWINTFDAIGDCVFIFDANGNIVRANAVALQIHGKSLDEMINTHCSTVCSLENPVHLTLIDQIPHSAEVTNKILNKIFLASSFPIFTQEGQLHRTILIAHDITEEKKLKVQLAQSQKMEAIGMLAGGVAHDLNNILSGVVSYPDIIIPQLPQDSPLRKQILAIQKSGQQAADIVADLLTLARGITANKQIIDLNALILEHLESPECKKIQDLNPLLTLSTNLDTALLRCCCSQVHIKKSLLNLIMNAAEAIKGNGQVTITTRNLEIETPKAKELHIKRGQYVVLQIADTGTGISAVDLERIFEPFYTKKVMGNSGSGLGLSIVWNSIKDHEGAIEVSSSSKGAEFTIYLPATEDQIPKEDQNPSLLDLKGHGESILIVDDDALQREIAASFIRTLGYKAEAVESGERR